MVQTLKQDNKSILIMDDLYFSRFLFENKKETGNIDLNVNHNINYLISEDGNQIKVEINTSIRDEKSIIFLELQTIGIFKINVEHRIEMELKNAIMKKNTVAIMFPFIRSQISIMTTQPGLKPIMLQPIDINNLVDSL